MRINEIVRERLYFLGISQTTLCKDVGVNVGAFNNFLNLRRGVSCKWIFQILRYLCLTFCVDGERESTMDVSDICKLVARRQAELGLTNVTIGKAVGVRPDTFCAFKGGYRSVSTAVLERILNVLGISIVPCNVNVKDIE